VLVSVRACACRRYVVCVCVGQTDRQTLAQFRTAQSGMIPYNVTLCLLIALHTRVKLMNMRDVLLAGSSRSERR
jgi:hypothetical protein